MELAVAIVAERAAELTSDVIMVANFFVTGIIKLCVALWAVGACLKVFFLLCGEELAPPCHCVVIFVLNVCHVFKVAEKVDNAVFSAPSCDFSRVLFRGCNM